MTTCRSVDENDLKNGVCKLWKSSLLFELFVLKSHYSKWLVTRHMSANHHGEQWIEKADPRRSSQRSELGRTKEEGTLWLDISQQQRIITWACGSQSQKKIWENWTKKVWPFPLRDEQITQELPHFCDDFSRALKSHFCKSKRYFFFNFGIRINC